VKLTSIFGGKGREREKFSPEFIKEDLIGDPSAAIEQAGKELGRLAGMCSEMAGGIMDMFRRKDPDFLHGLEEAYDKIEFLHDAVYEYLMKLFQARKDSGGVETETRYLTLLNELKLIASVVYRDIFPLAVELTEKDLFFSPDGWKQINDYHFRIYSGLKKAIEGFFENSGEKAREVTEEKMEIVLLGKQLIELHIDRLHRGLKESLETSAIHLDLISQLRRVNSFATDIAYIVMG